MADAVALMAKDACYQNLLKKKQELLITKLPSYEERRAAWRNVEKAYQEWAHMNLLAMTRDDNLAELELKLTRRKNRLIHNANRLQIHRLRAKLGRKFQLLNEEEPVLRKPRSEML